MFSSRKKSERLRITGGIVLALGLVAAGIFYWTAIRRPAADNLNALLDGYSRATRHEMGIQMGTLGLILLDWQDTLARPETQALLIAGSSALFSCYFFRAAWVLDDDEKDERERRQLEKGE